MSLDKNYQGTDVNLETSLEEYGFVARPITVDYADEYFVIYKMDDNQYGSGHIRESELDAIVNGTEWASEEDVNSMLETVGASKQEWMDLPFTSKFSDLVSYWGTENIMGTDYYPNDKNWAFEEIGLESDNEDSFAKGGGVGKSGFAIMQKGSLRTDAYKRVEFFDTIEKALFKMSHVPNFKSLTKEEKLKLIVPYTNKGKKFSNGGGVESKYKVGQKFYDTRYDRTSQIVSNKRGLITWKRFNKTGTEIENNTEHSLVENQFDYLVQMGAYQLSKQFADGGGVKIKSAFRLYNSPLIKFANFKDGSQINLMRLIKPYKNGEKYGISKMSINKIGDEVRIFKTLQDAESYFDKMVNEKKRSVDLREEVRTTNNYAKGGMLGSDSRLEYVTDAYASDSLQEELKEKLGIETDSLQDNYVISFAYTDYGGDFMDKVAIAYFKENYPNNTLFENAGYNGENAYVFGEPAKEWIETTQDYPLGFEDIEDFYYEKTSEQENEDFNYFLDEIKGDYSFDKDEALQWLNENRGGYFGMTTQGLDFSFEDLTSELVSEGVIEPNEEDEDEDFADGGGVELNGKKVGVAKRLKIKNWYLKTYPTDDLGKEIKDNLSFWSLYTLMSQRYNVYSVLQVSDSLVRERVFQKLSEILGVEYDYIYKMWLRSSDEYAKGGKVKNIKDVNLKINFTIEEYKKGKETIKVFFDEFGFIAYIFNGKGDLLKDFSFNGKTKYIFNEEEDYGYYTNEDSFAKGGGVGNFSKDEILIINQVLRNYLSDAESKLSYYSNGASRYFNEQVRGSLPAYIESAKKKVSEIEDDIKYFNQHKELPYGYLDTEHQSKLFLTNLNELPKTNNGREIFNNEIYGDKYYEVYEKLYDRLDSYVDNKFDIKYSNGGGVKSDYYIFEGIDNLNGKPLYRVESTSESDNEYVGEWHTDKSDAEKELKSFYADGGGVDDVSYEKIYEVLKENIDESIDDLGRTYENSSDFTGEEIEHKFRDGFIPYTNGGYELSWYEYVSTLNSTGYTLPTEKLQAEMQRHVDYAYELAKDTFKETYPEIVEVVGEDNIDYNSLDEAGFTDEAQELSDWEMENMSDEDTIRCSIIAYYYEPTNEKGQDGKHTISLQGDINLEAPYHRKGKNDDFTEVIFTFNSMEELNSKMDDGLKQVIDWFNGSKPTGSDDTFARGGKAKPKAPKIVRTQFEEGEYEYADGGALKSEKELEESAEYYFSDRYNLKKETLINDLENYIQMQKDLNKKIITPRQVVGTGYKNARKVAEEWISVQIQMTEYLIKHFDKKNKFANGGGVDDAKYFYVKGRNEDAPKSLQDTYSQFDSEKELIDYLNKWKDVPNVSFVNVTKVYSDGKSEDVSGFYLEDYFADGGGVDEIEKITDHNFNNIAGFTKDLVYKKGNILVQRIGGSTMWSVAIDNKPKGRVLNAFTQEQAFKKVEKEKFADGGGVDDEKPYQVYNYETQNIEGYFDNEMEAEEFASKFKNATVYDTRQYANGGGVDDADWIEESLIDLQNETGFDDLVVENSDNNHYTASNGNAEFEVFETEDDARERAIERVKEDLEENPEYFSKDWLMNYIDGKDFFTEVYNEWNESYANDIESEDSDKYANRLIEEMVENGIVSSEEAKEDDFDAEDYKDAFVELMTSNQMWEDNGLEHYIDNFGEEQAFKVVSDNNLIDIDKASESAVDTDGVAHFLSSYDGEQIDLSNGHVAYRTN
jgi:hypothetical protein